MPAKRSEDYLELHEQSTAKPAAFWGAVARQSLHWHLTGGGIMSPTSAWLTQRQKGWHGWTAPGLSPTMYEHLDHHHCPGPSLPSFPWTTTLEADSSCPHLLRWFRGGQTNAAFNELDRHVLQGHGSGAALFSEMPGGASTLGTAAPSTVVSRAQLLADSAGASRALVGHPSGCLGSDGRVAVHMLNEAAALVWIAACKRTAVPFTASAAGTPAPSLAHRLLDFGATLVVTSEILLSTAEAAVRSVLLSDATSHVALLVATGQASVDRVDVYGGGGGSSGGPESPKRSAGSYSAGLEGLIDGGGDHLSTLDVARLSCSECVRRCWQWAPVTLAEASHPLFVLYTSGSTGKPKGIVHTHGGYQVGLVLTSRIVLGLTPVEAVDGDGSSSGGGDGSSSGDVLFVVATPGWITGQSYMIAASLLLRLPSVLLEGSPVSPQPDRFAQIVARHQVTVLKTGSTMLRVLLHDARAGGLLAQHDLSSLRLVALCAEPVNAAVHRYASERLTRDVANTYWATEHGGIVFGAVAGNTSQPLVPDGRTWPLPWITADIWVAGEDGGEGGDAGGRARGRHRAADGHSGECVLHSRPPYMALTIWQATGFGSASWKGDVARWSKYFDESGGYIQGDTAVRHGGPTTTDGTKPPAALSHFTFHGRSDEVINVGGNRIGTAEIESALLAAGRRIATCAVVGRPHKTLGDAPCAFLVLRASGDNDGGDGGGNRDEGVLGADDERALIIGVKGALGSLAVPDAFVPVPALPETFSGKLMRRLLRGMLCGHPLGDLGGLRNPDSVAAIRAALSVRKLLPAPAEAEDATSRVELEPPNGDPHATAAQPMSGLPPRAGRPTLEDLLSELGLHDRYYVAMEEEGYETLDTWACFGDEDAALEVMAEDLGMSEADAKAIYARIVQALRG